MTVLLFPETLNGVAFKDDFSFGEEVNNRVVKIARLPLMGMVTSLSAALLNVIRLTISAVAIPFVLLAGLIFGNKSTGLALMGFIGVGLSVGSLLYSIANIATLGLLSWRLEISFKK